MGGKIASLAPAVAKMTPVEGLIIKAIGASIGSALALVFTPPRTWSGFIRRVVAGLGCGIVFAPYARDWAAFSKDWEGLLGSATLMAFVSWSAMSALTRLVRAWRKEE